MSDVLHDPSYAIARTRDEVLLYLDLHPCPDCGTAETSWEDGITQLDGELVIRYAGSCPGCDAEREYLFGMPQRETPGAFPNFGGPEASELLDAGQWLAVSDYAASSVAVDDRSVAAQEVMAIARAAVEEVVKFVPPGEDVVPDDAFWTDDGQAVRAAEPGRFRLERLLVVRDSYA
jgi:hypothetical protein